MFKASSHMLKLESNYANDYTNETNLIFLLLLMINQFA